MPKDVKKVSTPTKSGKKAPADAPVPAKSVPAKKTAAKGVAASTSKPAAKEISAPPATPVEAQAAPAPTHQEIAARAHQLWQQRGGHHGSHAHDWLQAEEQLKAGK